MTLINSPRLQESFFSVMDDESDLYGKKYWLEYQTKEFGNPNIFTRVRSDLSERCIFWLSKILKYKLPPAKTLELGCGHGGLVAMMKKVGFDAIGAELSEWVVEFAQKSFDINVLKGKIEDLNLQSESFDCIILMDVVEHFTDPVKSIKLISELINKDGLIIIQTPSYQDISLTYKQMLRKKHVFLDQMKAQEHLYLFTLNSLKRLLEQFGFTYVCTEPPLFPYDMFIIASKSPIRVYSKNESEGYLQKITDGRFIQALIDSFNQVEDLKHRLKDSDLDRTARLEIINRLNKQLEESEADRAARLEVINRLSKRLEEAEADRTARLEVINRQSKQLEESETDRATRLEVINRLNKQLEAMEAERTSQSQMISALNEQMEELKKQLEQYEENGVPKLKGRLIRAIKKL
jgi:2-polyprenyl-3-methyl-5-hydroxy-6-metoxy-1,4-benzoquinol methylase